MGADLAGANLSGALLSDAVYDEFTQLQSGLEIFSGSWGRPGDATPWDLGKVPAPEPASGLMLWVGTIALAGAGGVNAAWNVCDGLVCPL